MHVVTWLPPLLFYLPACNQDLLQRDVLDTVVVHCRTEHVPAAEISQRECELCADLEYNLQYQDQLAVLEDYLPAQRLTIVYNA